MITFSDYMANDGSLLKERGASGTSDEVFDILCTLISYQNFIAAASNAGEILAIIKDVVDVVDARDDLQSDMVIFSKMIIILSIIRDIKNLRALD